MPRPIVDRFAEIVAGRDAVVIECGACDGHHTKQLCHIGNRWSRSYHHIAIEPVPRLVDTWHQRIRIAHKKLRSRKLKLHLFPAAVGDIKGSAKLWVSAGAGVHDGKHQAYYGSSSLNKPAKVLDECDGISFNEEIDVEVMTLDDIMREESLTRVDFIWADIQGAERKMIAGGARLCLPRTRYLYTEYSKGGLYEGDSTLQQILDALRSVKGCDWHIDADYPNDDGTGDALFVNRI